MIPPENKTSEFWETPRSDYHFLFFFPLAGAFFTGFALDFAAGLVTFFAGAAFPFGLVSFVFPSFFFFFGSSVFT